MQLRVRRPKPVLGDKRIDAAEQVRPGVQVHISPEHIFIWEIKTSEHQLARVVELAVLSICEVEGEQAPERVRVLGIEEEAHGEDWIQVEGGWDWEGELDKGDDKGVFWV